MTRKLAYAAATAAVLLSVVPAFAFGHGVTLSNDAYVKNVVNTSSNTGFNSLSGYVVKGGLIGTGDATAVAGVENGVNTNSIDSQSFQKVHVDNDATVNNTVNTSANTGFNSIHAGLVKGGAVLTGDAGSQSVVTNVVNTNVVSTGFSL